MRACAPIFCQGRNDDPGRTEGGGRARLWIDKGALIFPAVKVQQDYAHIDDIIRMCRLRIRVPEGRIFEDPSRSLGAEPVPVFVLDMHRALAERMVDLDYNFQLWRYHHLKTVERIIGFKPGTGGTHGVSYLRRMLDVLQSAYDYPVDTEFTANFFAPTDLSPRNTSTW